jgi:hypothetical protein
MNSLENRVEQLERHIKRLEETVHELHAEKTISSERHTRRHKRSLISGPQRAIQEAQRHNSLFFKQGLKIAATTIGVCLLCWGGVELFERADHYFNHQGLGLPDAALNKITNND